MAESNYVAKKLQPFREKEALLAAELKKVSEELKKEEENNEKYNQELSQLVDVTIH
jgi:hypothetical protein